MNKENEDKKNLTIKEVSKLLGKSEMFVRIGIQRNLLPFGVAIKLPGRERYSYHIPPHAVFEYLGIEGVQNEKNILQ